MVVLRRDKITKLANLIKFDGDEDDEDDEDGQDDGEFPSSIGSSPSSSSPSPSSGAMPLKAAPRKRLGGRVGDGAVEVSQCSC